MGQKHNISPVKLYDKRHDGLIHPILGFDCLMRLLGSGRLQSSKLQSPKLQSSKLQSPKLQSSKLQSPDTLRQTSAGLQATKHSDQDRLRWSKRLPQLQLLRETASWLRSCPR